MTKHHPGVYAYASWRGVSIEAAAAELAEAPETDRNRVKWERVGHFVENTVRADADATIAQLLEALELARDYMHAHVMGLHEAYRGYPHRHARDDADLAKVDAAIKAAKGEA